MDLNKFYNDALNWAVIHIPKIFFAVLVLLIGIWMIRLLKSRIQNRMAAKKIRSTLQPFLLSLSVITLYVLLIVAVMQIAGIELSIFTAIIGAGTVTIGLALSGTFQNFAGGVLILLLRPFTIADNIIAQSVDGTVRSIQLFYTVVVTGDNKTVIIPNGKLFNEIITNVTREGKRRIDIELKLGYAIDIDQVKSIIAEAITKTENVIGDMPPIIGVSGMEIDGVKIAVKAWTSTDGFLKTTYALQEHIYRDLKAAGVKLPGT